jgi:hypothetical protein
MGTSQLGIVDKEVELPAHICLFYNGAHELRPRQLAFVQAGLAAPDEAILLFGAGDDAERVLSEVERDGGLDLSAELQNGRIALARGDVDAQQQLENVIGPLKRLLASGFSSVRLLGLDHWAIPGWPVPEDFLWYEARVAERLAELPVLCVCAYDASAMPGSAIVLGGLLEHPAILVANYADNMPFFERPDAYLASTVLRVPWLAPRPL